MDVTARIEQLRRQGLIESGFALATAVMLFTGSSSVGVAFAVGFLAVWMAVRGRNMVDGAVPLTEPERRELDRLKGESQHVRELLALLEGAGQTPVRYDLVRCRRLARVTSLLDGRT
jgi:hypothetical protein